MLAAIRITLAVLLPLAAASISHAAPTASQLYERALERERAVRSVLARGQVDRGLLAKARPVIVSYERVVRLHPRSGYCDNALWQGAELATEIWNRFGQQQDRATAIRLYKWLVREYPRSPFVARARTAQRRIEAAPAHARASSPPAPAPRPSAAPVPPAAVVSPAADAPAAASSTAAAETASTLPTLREIRRTVLPNAVRVIVELDQEVPYHDERLADPDRVFVDLKGVRADPDLHVPQDFPDGLVRQIRIGQHRDDTIRVVLDIDEAARHSVFALYSPYRLIIDMESPARPGVVRAAASVVVEPGELQPTTGTTSPLPDGGGAAVGATAGATTAGAMPHTATAPAAPLPSREPPVAVPAGPPAANLRGRFSLSRQLGLGVSRIVIDPGHGGKDPGARSRSLTEADLVLDVSLRLEQLLLKQEGFDVVLTRRSDVYIPLEERTAIANREDADLFLSIHANASRNKQANGIETYFLNFATSPDAEAVAARENAASGQTMHRLPDIVKAITLNNKLAESRDFATFVQRAMIERLRTSNKQVRDLGVKQAPFVVLIGAGMPSVLAEISFLTHAQEGRLLASPAYRQKIAEALLAGVLKYQRSLKSVRVAQSD